MVTVGEKFQKQLIDKNYTKGIVITPKYIVVHDTDDRDYETTAKFYRDYLSVNSKAKTSSHYIVDDKNIIQLLEDRWRGWHVTDSSNNFITNSNSIGIKMCVNKGSNIENTMDNMLLLIKTLMTKYDIPKENVVRHYDLSGKMCPRIMIEDNPSLWTSLIEGIENDVDRVTLYRQIAKGYLNPVLTKLNIKSQQNRISSNMGYISRGEEFNIYQFCGDWVKVLNKDSIPRFGYIKRDLIDIIENDKATNLESKHIDVESNYAEKHEVIKEIAAVVEKQNVATELKVKQDVVVELKEKQIPKKRISKPKIVMNENGVVSKDILNLAVRKGPDTSFYVISYLLPGENVKVIEQEGIWYYILYNSNRGERFGYVECENIILYK